MISISLFSTNCTIFYFVVLLKFIKQSNKQLMFPLIPPYANRYVLFYKGVERTLDKRIIDPLNVYFNYEHACVPSKQINECCI